MAADPATVPHGPWQTRPMRTRPRRRVLRIAAAVALVIGATALAATVPTPAAPAAPAQPPPAGTVAYGPGALKQYTAQKQPAPGTCRYRRGNAGEWLPDPACTPGALNPGVTERNIRVTICAKGWTDTVRPPGSITSREKRGSAAAYGYTGSFTTGEYDHLVPLSLGGDPNDPRNLWVEPNDDPSARSTNNEKDGVERRAVRAVCAGKLPLARAQRLAAADWTQLEDALDALT